MSSPFDDTGVPDNPPVPLQVVPTRKPPIARESYDLFDPPAQRGKERDWRDFAQVLRRRKWPALAMFIVVSVGAVVHAYTRVPVFQARARLLVEVDLAELAGVRDPIAQDRLMSTQQMQMTILQSRSLARRTLQALGRWPEAQPVAEPGPGAEASSISPTVMDTPHEAALIDGFLGGLRVSDGLAATAQNRLPTAGGLIDVAYVSTDPQVAARNVNTLVEQFIQQSLDRRSSAAKQLGDWLMARLDDQRKSLDASNLALQQYREKHGGLALPEQVSGAVQRITDLSETYTKAKSERISKEALLTQLTFALRSGSEIDSFPALPGYPSLQQTQQDHADAQRRHAALAQSLGERHPELIAARRAVELAADRVKQEVPRIAESVRGELAAALAVEQKLGASLAAERNGAVTLNRTDVQLAVLQRDSQSNREIYENLLQRLNELGVSQGQRSSNIRVLDPAQIPNAPLNDRMQQSIRYGGLAGIVLAVGLAFLLDHLDNAVKTPEQITSLDLPFLGLVPLLDSEDAVAGPLLNQKTSTAFSEAIRGLRTNVRLSIAAEGMRSLLVTSANAGEGKTMVASSLATALALSGERVMLIDTDLRRPRIHSVFSNAQAPGLTNLLIGEAKAAGLVHRTPVSNLDVMTSGTLPPNPSELLDSKRFREFMKHLGKHYDWVILDAPPIMPVTDAIVLADIVTGVLIVVAAESTPLPILSSAVDALERTTAIKIGAVLNKANLSGRSYYYSKYYRADYKSYHVQSSVGA
jgi:succinoglycan biosynthesis transport protein ExoP